MYRVRFLLLAALLGGFAVGYFFTPGAPVILNPISPKVAEISFEQGEVPQTLKEDPSTAFIHQLANASVEELPGFLSSVLDARDSSGWENFHLRLTPVLERWTELDAAGGARHAFQIIRPRIAKQIFAIWARQSPKEALAAAETWFPESQRLALLATALGSFAAKDPAEFHQALLSATPELLGALDPRPFADFLSTLATKDLPAAVALFERLPKPQNVLATRALASAYATSDPEAATAWALSIKNIGARDTSLGEIARALALTDPEAAAAVVTSFTDPSEFPVYDIAKILKEQDPEKALQWLNSLPPSNRIGSTISSLFIQEAAQDDPLLALDMICSYIPKFDDKWGNLSNGAFSGFSHEDFPSLAAELGSATNVKIASGLAQNWLRADPAAAASWLQDYIPSLPVGESQESLIDTLSRSLVSRDDSESALLESTLKNLSESLPQASREHLASAVSANLARELSPEATTLFLDHLATTEDQRTAFVAQSTRALVEENPTTAVAGLDRYTDLALRSAAHSSAATAWGRFDAEGASAWAASLPVGSDRDHAAAGLAISLNRGDREAVMPWLLSVTDADLRLETAQRIFAHLRSSDFRASALGAIRSSDLPSSEKIALLEFVGNTQ